MRTRDAEEAAAKLAAAEEAAAAEVARKLEAGNGEVVLHYSMYAESFTIADGRVAAAKIDEDYCLSDSMPGCAIHLSKVKTDFKGQTLKAPELLDLQEVGNPYVEEADGVFLELEKGTECVSRAKKVSTALRGRPALKPFFSLCSRRSAQVLGVRD